MRILIQGALDDQFRVRSPVRSGGTQTGTIAAVAVAFARFLGLLVPWVSESNYLIPPVHLSPGYAPSLSTTQTVGIALIGLLTWTNTRGLDYGEIVQNVFTTAKTGALIALIWFDNLRPFATRGGRETSAWRLARAAGARNRTPCG